jgi:hypothetical protein
MPFKKGQSGNPSGRPKSDSVISDLAKTKTNAALACLVEIMESEEAPAAARVSAAQAILDRGWGKPSHATPTSDAGNTPGNYVFSWVQDIRAAAAKP